MSAFDYNAPISGNSWGVDPSLGVGTNPYGADISNPVLSIPQPGGGGISPNGIAAGGMALNAFSSIASSIFQSNALQMQAKYASQQLNFKAQIAQVQAQGALDEGEHQAEQIERSGQQQVGAERTSEAAGGVNVNAGSAAATQSSTQAMTALDALTARNNAARQAWGYEVSATQEQGEAQIGEIAAQGQSTSTLLTGGLNAAAYGSKAGYYGMGGAFSA
jgi:hypothetical protein